MELMQAITKGGMTLVSQANAVWLCGTIAQFNIHEQTHVLKFLPLASNAK